MSFSDTFSDHGFELSSEELAKFEQFLWLFMEYNAHTNLSAIRDEEGVIVKHFIDSLYGVALIQEMFSEEKKLEVLDIGSGGGFPGIPLKIVLPHLHITLLDSVGKKVNAMSHFIEGLGLSDIRSIKERAEILAKDPKEQGRYDLVVSRATAYITDILTWATPFLAKNGMIILYKMPSDDEKKDQKKICHKLGLVEVASFEYELADKKRVLLVFQKK
jgi:16S rRNA (guanine527-N7)-methyltransferase